MKYLIICLCIILLSYTITVVNDRIEDLSQAVQDLSDQFDNLKDSIMIKSCKELGGHVTRKLSQLNDLCQTKDKLYFWDMRGLKWELNF